MGFPEKFDRLTVFVFSQFKSFIEILRLKIRIIGFANKRSSLFTRLGEAASETLKNGEFDSGDSLVRTLLNEITQSDREIAESERSIEERRQEAQLERASFRENFMSGQDETIEPKPAENPEVPAAPPPPAESAPERPPQS